MKKRYIKPATELIDQYFENHLCAGTRQRMAVKPNAYWGEKVEQNQYAKDAWINEGHTGRELGFSQGPVIPVAGDDTDDLFSRSNTSLWDD